ncbi:hypothetical protein JD844_025985 [Phrynosoma platyrhinos]|uniref:Fucosyltransferase n=1 Tax=Phrynosoma platyrhinos TaxID=52577 RepID=A0ABQ7SEC5_PHRPL|nr:hypothetical protein JD844_025985 [Phrynosoma platyrhinos]
MDSNGQPLNRTCQKVLTFALFQLGLSAVLFTYIRISGKPDPGSPVSVMLYQPKQLEMSLPVDKRSSNLTILLWTWPFGTPFAIERCSQALGIPNCDITANRSWYQKADAVIVHHQDVCGSPERLPQEPRPPFQRWIWFNMESPSATPNLSFMDKRFNLTMTYRRDSDIFSPYGMMEVLPHPQNITIPPKSKLVAWVVSNWDSGSQRVKYYEELRKYLQVDVYGKYHLPLLDNKLLSTLSQYKFYLSFENAIHKDYITEKVWRNAFNSWAVPVVLGPPRKNYENYMPPDSFIHVNDFPSAQELAKFLLELDRNTTRYQSYFHWRSWLKLIGQFTWPQHFCKACWELQKKPLRYQTLPALSKWFK